MSPDPTSSCETWICLVYIECINKIYLVISNVFRNKCNAHLQSYHTEESFDAFEHI